jgi:hypothetical protein
MESATVVRPRGTVWGAVLAGWIASVGVAALLAPLVVSALGARALDGHDLAFAVPPVLGVIIAYLVGGYVAGRMAGHSTSWHGMLTAFFGLFVVLAAIIVGVAADRGVFGDLRLLHVDSVYPWAFNGPATVGNAMTFGAILGFLAAIFSGWLGGLLAPTAAVATVAATTPVAATVRETRVVERPRPGFHLLPQAGRKGGERIEREERIEGPSEERVERYRSRLP